jgi:hypothetical protein
MTPYPLYLETGLESRFFSVQYMCTECSQYYCTNEGATAAWWPTSRPHNSKVFALQTVLWIRNDFFRIRSRIRIRRFREFQIRSRIRIRILYEYIHTHTYTNIYTHTHIYRVAAIFPEHFQSFTVALKNHILF